MKKIITIMLSVIMGLSVAQARDLVTRNVADIPAQAQSMLKKYFPKKTVNHIKIDKKLVGDTEYDVILNDGTEIDFNGKGEWEEIDCGNNSIPTGILPNTIHSYVKQNYKGAKIISVEKKNNKYEIELSNGVDLLFDRAGNFLKIEY